MNGEQIDKDLYCITLDADDFDDNRSKIDIKMSEFDDSTEISDVFHNFFRIPLDTSPA